MHPLTAYMVTRSCTQQQFLMRPDREMNNAFIYCLAVAAQRFDVRVMMFNQLSNHKHEDVYDRRGNLPAFYHYFHTLLAKCVNTLRGRVENVFSSHQTNLVRLVDEEALIDKLVYVATNAVKHDLVATAEEWPGANGYRALIEGKPIRATRPKFFFSSTSKLPEEIKLKLEIPPELGDAERIIAEVKRRVKQFELDAAARREAAGKKVLGSYAINRQSWRDMPAQRKFRRGIAPTFSARIWARIEAAHRKVDFENAHAEAVAAWRAGNPVQFPYGTYRMRQFDRIAAAFAKKST